MTLAEYTPATATEKIRAALIAQYGNEEGAAVWLAYRQDEAKRIEHEVRLELQQRRLPGGEQAWKKWHS